MAKQPEYKWASPAAWLHDHVYSVARGEDPEHAVAGLIAIIGTLILVCENEDLQDVFQRAMDRDGYFTKEP